MRFALTSFAVSALAASSAVAQTSPLALAQSALAYLTPNCQQVALSLISPSSPIGQCAHISALAPLLTTNGSIVPVLDGFMSSLCSSAPCSNATLTNVTQQILTGCATDFANYNVSNATVTEIFELYPLARELLCLKTTVPFNSSIASNATTASNSTGNGTFCVTSLLNEVSTYLNASLTVPYLENIAFGGNASGTLKMLETIPPTALCNDCIFAAVDLVEEEFPSLGNLSIGSNYTINSLLTGTCNATSFRVSTNGTLPSTIIESAVNSTFGYNVTIGNTTYTPLNGSAPGPSKLTLRGEPAMKKRWFGSF